MPLPPVTTTTCSNGHPSPSPVTTSLQKRRVAKRFNPSAIFVPISLQIYARAAIPQKSSKRGPKWPERLQDSMWKIKEEKGKKENKKKEEEGKRKNKGNLPRPKNKIIIKKDNATETPLTKQDSYRRVVTTKYGNAEG